MAGTAGHLLRPKGHDLGWCLAEQNRKDYGEILMNAVFLRWLHKRQQRRNFEQHSLEAFDRRPQGGCGII
jgi:hypothetical protein